MSGGGGGNTYYDNAEKLYGVQADTAQFMLDIGKGQLPGAVERYADAATAFSDPEYAARMAGQAGADAEQAVAGSNAALVRNLSRYGINPNSGRGISAMSDNAMRGAAIKAGAMNNARRFVEDKRFGATKDFYSSLVGMNSDAAGMAGQAGGNFAQMGAQQQSRKDNEDAAWGNALGMGAAYMFKDGGEVKYGAKMARGGLFGGASAMPPPPVAAQPSAGPMHGVDAGKKLKDAMSGAASDKIMGAASKGLAGLADMTGSTALGEAALGAAGAGVEQAAMLAGQNAGLSGATAATAEALGAGTAMAGEAAAAASPLLSGAAAAVPWVAAGAAIGKLFGLFADGGEVDRVPMQDGGKVKGKGTETSDDVPAWLSKGEYVVNAESVKMPGVKQALEKINSAGLAKRYGVM